MITFNTLSHFVAIYFAALSIELVIFVFVVLYWGHLGERYQTHLENARKKEQNKGTEACKTSCRENFNAKRSEHL